MSGLRSRRKGVRVELAIAKLTGARKVSRAYQAVECRARADGFRQLYDWLDRHDVLIVESDRQQPLVVVRLSLAAEIAKKASKPRFGGEDGHSTIEALSRSQSCPPLAVVIGRAPE